MSIVHSIVRLGSDHNGERPHTLPPKFLYVDDGDDDGDDIDNDDDG